MILQIRDKDITSYFDTKLGQTVEKPKDFQVERLAGYGGCVIEGVRNARFDVQMRIGTDIWSNIGWQPKTGYSDYIGAYDVMSAAIMQHRGTVYRIEKSYP